MSNIDTRMADFPKSYRDNKGELVNTIDLSIEAMEELIEKYEYFLSNKSFNSIGCPLCLLTDTLCSDMGLEYINEDEECEMCPWVIMTGLSCQDPTNKPLWVGSRGVGAFKFNEILIHKCKERIQMIQEWIEYYKQFRGMK